MPMAQCWCGAMSVVVQAPGICEKDIICMYRYGLFPLSELFSTNGSGYREYDMGKPFLSSSELQCRPAPRRNRIENQLLLQLYLPENCYHVW